MKLCKAAVGEGPHDGRLTEGGAEASDVLFE